MNDPHETTETHLERLLGRALNSFDLPDALVERLDSALAHASSLCSAHHSAGLHRETYRHSYLLTDGSTMTLWELVHNTGRGGAQLHELYADEEEAQLAASRLCRPGSPEAPRLGSPDPLVSPGPPPLHDFDLDLDLLDHLLTTPPTPAPRMYVPDNSRTTPAGSCAARRTRTGRARRRLGCCGRLSRTTSRRCSGGSARWRARMRDSCCTSTRSYSLTAVR